MTPWEQEHNKRVESYANRIRLIYREAAAKAGKLASLPGYDPAKPFNIENYPHAKARIDKILKEVYTQTKYTITEGIDKEWYESNRKLDAQVRARSPKPPKEWMQHNEEDREAFKIRKDAGMDLSKRVWNLTEQFKQELELAIDIGLTDGRSAAELSRDVRQYLNEPNKLFRRVRNKATGKLQLSRAAKAYHPGRGVYRSSYKNAMRLTRTETNMAYRGADHLRYQQLDFVLGFEVHLSNNHPVYDICDELKGKYPKGFKFVGWHPHCRCYVTTLLMDEKEFNAVEDRLLAGEDISDYVSPNSHMTVPTGMTKWVKANKDRVGNYAKMPYFIRDNFVGGRIDGGLDTSRLIPKVKPAKLAPVPAPIPALESSLFDNITQVNTSPDQVFEMLDRAKNKHSKLNLLDGVNRQKELAAKYHSIMGGFDMDEFIDDTERTIKKHGIKLKEINLSYTKEAIFMEVKAPGFSMIRAFTLGNDGLRKVSHTFFKLNPKLQGTGISKEVFANLHKQYIKGDIGKIELHANLEVGGYTWGRYGFSLPNATKASEYLNGLGISDLPMLEKGKAIIADFYKKNAANAPFPMNLLSDTPGFKKHMLGSEWDGILDLRNKVQRQRFEDYLYGRL